MRNPSRSRRRKRGRGRGDTRDSKVAAPPTAEAAPLPVMATVAPEDVPAEAANGFAPQVPDAVAKDPVSAFFSRAAGHLAALRRLTGEVNLTADIAARQDRLAELYLELHSISPPADQTELRPIVQLSSTLAGLLRKLLEDPKYSTPSTLNSVTKAVELLCDLCSTRPKADLGTSLPMRLLVVDDDPITRRAITGALQTAFEKPENMDNGEAALAAAAARPFDTIFLDVQMPGMDGFTVCSKLREMAAHRNTPVVFVSGQTDTRARTQCGLAGGSDFIAKPFLAIEITLKALTHGLRARLKNLRSLEPVAVPKAPELTACATAAAS